MSELLDEVIRTVRALPPERRDHYAALLLETLEQDEKWETTLRLPESLDLLDEWAAEALADRRAGRSQPLTPDTR